MKCLKTSLPIHNLLVTVSYSVSYSYNFVKVRLQIYEYIGYMQGGPKKVSHYQMIKKSY